MLTELPPVPTAAAPPPIGGADHPMRQVTRAVAAGSGAWTPDLARRVQESFDVLAAEWHTRLNAHRLDALYDAFERGWPDRSGVVCLELGSGTGFATPWLAERFPTVVAMDLSHEMLARASADVGFRVQADAARLPLRDGSVDAAVLINMLLFAQEIDRVLAPSGRLVWVNTSGEDTPIHLPSQEVHDALPGEWTGVASRTGHATWAVLRRA